MDGLDVEHGGDAIDSQRTCALTGVFGMCVWSLSVNSVALVRQYILSRRMMLTTFNELTPCYHRDCAAGFNTRSREGLGTRRPALSRVPLPG